MSNSSEADRSYNHPLGTVADSTSTHSNTTAAKLDLSDASNEADTIIELVEETARIEKRLVEKGRIRVTTRTEVSEQVLRETLRGDAVHVTRVPIDRVIAEGETAPQIRHEGGLTIIPVLEEVLVVEKRLVLKEEVHIRHSASDENVEVPVTLRRQRAVIEHVRPEGDTTETPSVEKGS